MLVNFEGQKLLSHLHSLETPRKISLDPRQKKEKIKKEKGVMIMFFLSCYHSSEYIYSHFNIWNASMRQIVYITEFSAITVS